METRKSSILMWASILCIVAMMLCSVTFAASPVVKWEFEGNFTDGSGNSNNGTASGSPVFASGLGGIGQCVLLDGIDDEIKKEAANNLPTNPTAPWSINMYLCPSKALTDWTPVGGFGKPDVGTADPAGERHLIRFASQMYFWGSGADVVGVAPFDIGEWQMVTITFTGTPDNILRIYKNGSQTNSAIVSNYGAVEATAAVGWAFVGRYAGKMDDFSILDGAMTPSEITALVPYLVDPEPTSQSVAISLDQVLSWADASGMYTSPTYDVYFGTDPVGRNNPKLGTNLVSSQYAPVGMASATQYYWAFDVKENGTTVVYGSETYTFTTKIIVPATKILEWSFNGNTNDTVGTNHGTSYGSPQYVAGVNGQAINFVSQGDLVANISATGLPVLAGDKWSINMYVKTEVSQLWTVLGGFGYAGVPELGVGKERYILDLGQYYFWGGVGQDVGTGAGLDLGKWQMLTVTCDGSLVSMYKNGVLLASGSPALADTVQEVGVAFQGALGTTWIGKMDEFTIWDRPLTGNQINELVGMLPIYQGDINGDDTVGPDDLSILAAEWLLDWEVGVRNYFPQGFQAGIKAVLEVPRAVTAPTIDGVLTANEWDNAMAFEVIWPDVNTAPKQADLWYGAAPASATDFSATWYLKWDVNNFYIAVSVYDPTLTFTATYPGPYNAQDAVQFEFNLNETVTPYLDGTSAIYDFSADTADGVGGVASRNQNQSGNFSAAQLALISVKSTLLTDGYIIEAAMPWSVVDHTGTGYVPAVNDTHGVGFLHLDFNGNALVRALSAFTDQWDPATWKTLKLVDTSVQHSSWPWNTGSPAYRLFKADLEPKDNIVNLKDFAILASDWLK